MNLIPNGDRIIVQQMNAETVSPGGLIIPETAREKPQRGTVVAVGAGRTEQGRIVPVMLRVGDVVMYGKYSGNEIEVDGAEYIVMRESDVILTNPPIEALN